MLKRSPMAPACFPAIKPVAGVELAGQHIGLKKAASERDLMVARLANGTEVAGVLTRSQCPSAPVVWCRRALNGGIARVIIVNSANANAFTGMRGETAVTQTVDAATRLFECSPEEVFVASTGVIGEPLAPDLIPRRLQEVVGDLRPEGWLDAAEAIRTTDTFPKAASADTHIGGTPVRLAGIAKGSGMIAPDMATMLAFVFTDAHIPAGILQKLLRSACDASFNAITVDGDTSTSDTLLLCATGQAEEHPAIASATDSSLKPFRHALLDVCIDLAQQIVRDGEGAQKFVTVNVCGAESQRAARRIGLSIANSPLVKTAIAGEDANWGRIVMAVGKAGEKADRDRLSISIGGVRIAERGEAAADYDEAPVAAHMQGREIDIDVDLGIGHGRATVWTCDLTHRYIDINADYRT